jgi:hypothetical protein
MQNRFNRVGSKEWLPFQKSWFRYSGHETLYRSNLRFFCKAEADGSGVFYIGSQRSLFENICREENIPLLSEDDTTSPIQFVCIDLLDEITESTTPETFASVDKKVCDLLLSLYPRIEHRRFVNILARNVQAGPQYFAYAWLLAKKVSEIFSLKDEKIGCMEDEKSNPENRIFQPQKGIFYSLYFRKDELSKGTEPAGDYDFFTHNQQQAAPRLFENDLPAWFILKPQPRKKQEVLHPAKYPEDLVDRLVKVFTEPGQTVFDPMSGTGSTQVGALRQGRNAFGTELSEFFAGIANQRCDAICQPSQTGVETGQLVNLSTRQPESHPQWKITQKDARQITAADTLPIDYLLTSPPYWDMLNMKGAENQAKRVEKGLQTNYSDHQEDLGNLSDYNAFVKELADIYFNIYEQMQPGAYATIVVKNIKKKGSNYPFAWDLTLALQEKFILLPEVFWCQDDLNLAPYGFGNTWVSNTFHQYCLNFQKPLQ